MTEKGKKKCSVIIWLLVMFIGNIYTAGLCLRIFCLTHAYVTKLKIQALEGQSSP